MKVTSKLIAITVTILLCVLLFAACNNGQTSSYKVTVYDGDTEIAKYEVKDGKTVTINIEGIAGYDIDGLFYDKEFTKPYSIDDVIEENTTLYLKKTATAYAVKYFLGGGINDEDNPSTYTVFDDDIVLAPATLNGYLFTGWVDEDNQPVTQIDTSEGVEVSLTATYSIITYTISYQLEGGENNNNNPTQYTVEDSQVTLLPASKTDWDFAGWVDQENKPVTVIDPSSCADISLTATWRPKEYTISYSLNGGVNAQGNPDTYTKQDEDIVLAPATLNGYLFTGWVDENNQPVTQIDTSAGVNVTLNATFSIITYTISYELNGGINSDENAASYTIEDTVVLHDANYSGHQFNGWYAKADFSGDALTQIDAGTTGDIKLYASFTALQLDVNFYYQQDLIGATKVEYNDFVDPAYFDNLPIPVGCDVDYYYHTLNGYVEWNYLSSVVLYNLDVYVSYYSQGGFETEATVSTMISAYTGTETDLVLPWIFNGNVMTAVGIDAFKNQQFDSVTIPDSYRILNTGAFSGCGITTLNLSANMEILGYNCFTDNALTEFTVGAKVNTIYDNFLTGNTGLQKVNVLTLEPAVLTSAAFSTEAGYVLYVPQAEYAEYLKQWQAYASIIDVEGCVIFSFSTDLTDADPIAVKIGELPVLPEISAAGYVSVGFYKDAELSDQYLPVAAMEDTVLYVKYSLIAYTIEYVLNGGTNSPMNTTPPMNMAYCIIKIKLFYLWLRSV